jgi:hypothetical protein
LEKVIFTTFTYTYRALFGWGAGVYFKLQSSF